VLLGRAASAGSAAWQWLAARPARALAAAVALSCLLRLPFVDAPFGDDEGGYLYVAQHWSGHGHWLYGNQWVDRPPALVLLFRLVAALGGTPVAMRVVAMGLAAVLVASAWYAGRRLAGNDGAVAAALCAAALASNPAVLGHELISDGIGATFVTVSFALVLAAIRRRESGTPVAAYVLAGLAGVAGVTAFLSKQSAVLGMVVAAVVLGGSLRRHWPLAAAYVVGVLVPLAGTLAWAVTGPGLGMLVNALYTFRVGAARAMADSSTAAPAARAGLFVLVMIGSGFVFPLTLLVVDLVLRRGQWRLRATVTIAAACLLGVIVASLNWYAYYWLAVVPLAAVGAAVAFVPGARLGRIWPRLVVALTVLFALANVAVRLPVDDARPAVSVFVRRAAAPGDTVTVIWGQPNLMEDTGLRTPYPYSWSLPVRVEDPHLRLFAATLAGPRAPTWMIEIGHFDDWGIETPRVARIVARRYHVAATVCGHAIYLRDGVARPVAAAQQGLSGGC
jgi:hypothetical protein